MEVGLYARTSTDDKHQNPETQLFAMREFCKKADWKIVAEYVDCARAKDYASRKQWQQLEKDARQFKFKTVLVFRLDRAFRSVRECTNTVQEWYDRGIAFKSLREDVIDTTTSQGRFILHIMAAVAELESSIIGERVSAGMARVKAGGGKIGRPGLSIPSQTICEALRNKHSVKEAAIKLGCSVPYIYKVLKPLGYSPTKIVKETSGPS